MAGGAEQPEFKQPRRLSLPRKRRWRALLLVFVLVAASAVVLWISRERIAGDLIEAELERLDLPASYEIVSITPQKQLLRNLVVGDVENPDLVIEEIAVNLEYGFAGPSAGKIIISRPRLYGSFHNGKASFGALDPVLFGDSEEPVTLPALDLAIIDGRALIESDYGAIAAKFDGSGRLEDDFVGSLAITAPGAGIEGCSAQTATAFGEVTTQSGVPSFAGPVRLGGVNCEGVSIASAAARADLALTQDFSGLGGTIALAAKQIGYSGNASDGVDGDITFEWSDSGLNVRHDLTATGTVTAFGSIRKIRADGDFRSDADLKRSDWNMDLNGSALSLAGGLDASLSNARQASEGTLFAALLSKFERSFRGAATNADLSARITLRQAGDAITASVPEAYARSPNGDIIVAVSRVSWTNTNSGSRLSGNFVTGGAGLPQMNGRMEQTGDGARALRMTMADYSEGADRLAIPRLQINQKSNGDFAFSGVVSIGGAIPGGSIRALELPIEGDWSSAGGLAIGRTCSEIKFASLALSELELADNQYAVCPGRSGAAMVRFKEKLEIDAATRSIELSGQLAGSPVAVQADEALFSYPGGFALNNLSLSTGEEGSSARLFAEVFKGRISDEAGSEIGGDFAFGTAQLDFVPLDLSQIAGDWVYRDGAFTINDASFSLTERIAGTELAEARFEPLIASGAALTLIENTIIADADLRHPASLRLVTGIGLNHNLGTGAGSAAVTVPGLVFDGQLRPEDISQLAKGVIAFADGTITGGGTIEWFGDEVSSEGTFSTQGMNLAAAFGPIDDLRGTIRFDDLINMTTAPSQVLEVGAVNPGIQVLGGRVQYSLTNGETIAVEDARWPFMGGELILRPVDIRYGTPGEQLYVFEIVGLDAETFIAQMELSNLGASGTFDGSVPILFDDQGNGTIGTGLLISRPPGGNVSYVGELTYEDMGAITNFAFQSLRSLDYSQMSIGLDGSLAGEIITSFKIDGVRQGVGADRNLLTRELAKLPIRFNVNVRSQNFYQLATMVRSFFDAEYLSNPVDQGLLTFDGERLAPRPNLGQSQPDAPPQQDIAPDKSEIRRDDESPVQPLESDGPL